MLNDDIFVFSSSGHHMFITINDVDFQQQGFFAKIHHGNEINDIKIRTSKF